MDTFRGFLTGRWVGIGLLCGLATTHLSAQEEEKTFRYDFEAPEGYDPGDPVKNTDVWSESDEEVVITDQDAASGRHAVVVPPTQKISMLRGHFPGLTSPTFVDVHVKPAGESYVAMERFGDAPAHTTLSKVQPSEDGLWGAVYVMDGDGEGNGEWVETGLRFAIYDGYPVDWLRFTYRIDYETSRWDFYLDGRLIAGNLGFVAEDVKSFTHFTFHGDAEQAVFLDDFTISESNPLFPDKDKDGIDDRFEEASGWDSSLDDRLIAEGERNRLQAYMEALGDDEDSDNDGLTNGEERQLGTDPNAADTRGQPGIVLWEQWKEHPENLDQIKRRGLGSEADKRRYVDKLEIERESGFGKGEQYVSRMSGYLLPPATGNYRFWIAGDDHAELWLSEDDSPFKRRIIARVTGWTSPREFEHHGSQRSEEIFLEAGKRYYIEIWHRDLVGEDHLAVAWTTPQSSRRLIGANYLQALDGPLENDQDRDGLPDDWEASFGLRTDSALQSEGAHGDADGDFLDNYDEYRYGTNPVEADTEKVRHLLRWEVWSEAPGEHIGLARTLRQGQEDPNAFIFTERVAHYREVEEYFASRLQALLQVSEGGRYRFWLSADNKGEVWLSPDAQPFDKERICLAPEYTRAEEWNKYKTQESAWIDLEEGSTHYLEVWHKEVVGGSHITVAWEKEGWGERRVLTIADVRNYEGTPEDGDNDGLPDAWESATGLDMSSNRVPDGAFGDADGDGMNNLEEYQEGWDPIMADGEGRAGYVSWEAWDELYNPGIETLLDHQAFPEAPDRKGYFKRLAKIDEGYSNFAMRVRGLITPAQSGLYQFWISGDEDVELWLSTTDSKFERRLIASTGGETGEEEWDKRGLQASQAIELEGGQSYYVEVRLKESWWATHFAVAWQGGDIASREVIGATHLRSFAREEGDKDDDDLPDDWEEAQGIDPNDASHAQSGYGDLDGDGLRNLEEWAAGTDAFGSDSDGDGLSDFEEVLLGLDPTQSQGGSSIAVASLDLRDYAASRPEKWEFLSYGAMYNLSPRASVEEVFELSDPGMYFFELLGSFGREVTASVNRFIVEVDGVFLGIYKLQPYEDGHRLSGRLPYLGSGQHVVRIIWDNPHLGFSLQVKSFSVRGWQFEGGWPSELVDGQYELEPESASSLVSPVCVEGLAWNPAFVSLTPEAEVLMAPNDSWYANVPLLPDGSETLIEASFENGAVTQQVPVSWTTTNVLGWERETMRVREGDALRLTILLERQSEEDGKGSLWVNDELLAESVTEPIIYTFENAGTYEVKAVYQDEEGEVIRSLIVEALANPFPETLHVLRGEDRELSWPSLDTEATVEADRRLTFRELTLPEQPRPRQFLIGINQANATRALIARLNDDESAPIFGGTQIKTLDVRSGTESYTRVVDRLSDGSYLVEMGIVARNLPPGFRMKVEIVVAGVTFEDGSLVKWLTAEDFDETGLAKIRFIKSEETLTSVCHRFEYFVGDEKIN